MTDAEFLEHLRKDKRLTQSEMAELLDLKSPSAYQRHIYSKKPFSKKTIERFTEKLKLKKWNDYTPTDDYSLVKALYNRVIKLEKMLTGKTEKQIKTEIEMQRKKIISAKKR